VVKVNGRDSKAFGVSVDVHQVMLSPLRFVIMLQAVSSVEGRHTNGPAVYADDLVLMADMEEVPMDTTQKNSMEKGLD